MMVGSLKNPSKKTNGKNNIVTFRKSAKVVRKATLATA